MTLLADIIITSAATHISRIDRASTRRVRKMTQDAVSMACTAARRQGAVPVSMVDDLTMHTVAPWIEIFGKCLVRSAKREGISIVGGEMAQMPDSYTEHYVGVWVTVISLNKPDVKVS